MKIHSDGTMEGTPVELAEYARLASMDKQYQYPVQTYPNQWPTAPHNPLLPPVITCVYGSVDAMQGVTAWN